MFVKKQRKKTKNNWKAKPLDISCESEIAVTSVHWQGAVSVPGSAPGVKPLLRLLGLGGEPSGGVASALWTDSTTEQLFLGSRGWTSMDLGMTDACRRPSARSGGLTSVGPVGGAVELGGLGLHGGEGLAALWSTCLDSSFWGTCWSEGVASFSPGAESAVSGGGSCCMLLCLEVTEPGISQLSVRRRDPSCILLVATTAFMAAC